MTDLPLGPDMPVEPPKRASQPAVTALFDEPMPEYQCGPFRDSGRLGGRFYGKEKGRTMAPVPRWGFLLLQRKGPQDQQQKYYPSSNREPATQTTRPR
jgi:hypothetical protein